MVAYPVAAKYIHASQFTSTGRDPLIFKLYSSALPFHGPGLVAFGVTSLHPFCILDGSHQVTLCTPQLPSQACFSESRLARWPSWSAIHIHAARYRADLCHSREATQSVKSLKSKEYSYKVQCRRAAIAHPEALQRRGTV